MNNRFFFVTTYDSISGTFIASALNEHPDIHCGTSFVDPFLYKFMTEWESHGKHKVVDNFIVQNMDPDKLFNGNAQRFSAFDLHNKILSEKTVSPIRAANIAISPALRINFLLKSWIESAKSPELACTYIEQKLQELSKNKSDLFEKYIFHYFYNQIVNTALNNNVDLNNTENKLFLFALAKVIAYDTADLPTSIKTFCFENLLSDADYFIEFINYITLNKIKLTSQFQERLNSNLQKANLAIKKLHSTTYTDWQNQLIEKYINTRLYTIYYPHIDKPLLSFYSDLGYKLTSNQNKDTNQLYSKLISIQLNSNRPSQLVAYFDNIEETADHPEQIEVLININSNDAEMESILRQQAAERPFTIKYICTPKPKSFCDLWQPINRLLEITDPNAYFLLNISDEMLFATKGWDTILKKYVGIFPDHLFRLRASRNKFRNYFDRWECSFAQDAIPITTKKWIDVGGDWNPCFGPDSFQQLISFYLTKESIFSSSQHLREIPIIDIKFHGDVPGLGIDHQKAWKHNSDHIKAMQICQSHKMQLEARRRAMLIKANIIAYANQLESFELVDLKSKKEIHLIDKTSHTTTHKIPYHVSWLKITFVNQIRKFHFNEYFGGGIEARKNILLSTLGYLKSKHLFFFRAYKLALRLSKPIKIKLMLKPLFRRHHQNNNLEEENSRLKSLYQAACLENEKLNNMLLEPIVKSTFELKYDPEKMLDEVS